MTSGPAKVKLYRHHFYKQPLLVVDGLTRTGKTMMCPILTSFEGVELPRMEMMLDRIPRLFLLRKITKDAAVALLRLEVQTKLYESMISRNTNFRWKDHSGVFRQVKFLRYLKRIFAKEGDSVVQHILEKQPIFQVQLHDLLGMNGLYFDTFGESLRIVEMIRHPVDSIYSNYSRGYGEREDKDPRIFSLNILHKKKLVPWYTFGWEDEYISCKSPADKVIKMCSFRIRKMWNGYDSLSSKQQSQILFIDFEKFVTHPDPYLRKIELFVGRKRTRHTNRALQKGGVPRVVDIQERKRKEEEIRAKASPECQKIMDDLMEQYEEKSKLV